MEQYVSHKIGTKGQVTTVGACYDLKGLAAGTSPLFS